MKNKVVKFIVQIVVLLFILAMGSGLYEDWQERSDKKKSRQAICAERIENIKNEFTAKQLFKVCMNEK